MIIDCHAHLVPQSWYHPKSPKWMFDLPHLFDEQDKSGVDVTVFGNNWIRSPDGYDPLKVVQEFNVHAAELTAKHPERLLGLACSVPYDNGPILKETERAIREYKLKGIMINSSTNGEYLDSPRAAPFFEMVSDLNVPVFVHPPSSPSATKRWKSSACRRCSAGLSIPRSRSRASYSPAVSRNFPN